MDYNQLLQFYASRGISSRPIDQGIASVGYTTPVMPKIIEDQGSSEDRDIDITKQGIGPYTGLPIRFRDVAGLFMNPMYGVPNIMARSAGYESPLDFAKKQGQAFIDQRKGRLDITSDDGFGPSDSGDYSQAPGRSSAAAQEASNRDAARGRF